MKQQYVYRKSSLGGGIERGWMNVEWWWRKTNGRERTMGGEKATSSESVDTAEREALKIERGPACALRLISFGFLQFARSE